MKPSGWTSFRGRGHTYSQTVIITTTDLESNETTTAQYTLEFTYEADEARTVPAGRFECARIRTRITFTSTVSGLSIQTTSEELNWAAPEVGSVESRSTLTTRSDTPGNGGQTVTETFLESRLKSALVGGKTYP